MAFTGDVSEPVADVIRPGSRRGAAGYYQVGQDAAGRWWMLDPDGQPLFLRGVHGVAPAPGHHDGGLPDDPAARLRRWGFNAVGVGPDGAAREDGVPYLGVVEFSRGVPSIVCRSSGRLLTRVIFDAPPSGSQMPDSPGTTLPCAPFSLTYPYCPVSGL